MKRIFILFLLIVISDHSIAQKSLNEPREIKEIKSIFKDFNNKEFNLPFYIQKNGTLILPSYFKSSQEFFLPYISNKTWPPFTHLNKIILNLSKSDCSKLNNTILNDTSRLYIQTNWFDSNKILILCDSITNKRSYNDGEYMKPIFFRNYSRCFMAIYYAKGLETFFLKKKNNKWVLDKFYIRTAED